MEGAGFPKGYEKILEDYYKRLARESVGKGEAGDDR